MFAVAKLSNEISQCGQKDKELALSVPDDVPCSPIERGSQEIIDNIEHHDTNRKKRPRGDGKLLKLVLVTSRSFRCDELPRDVCSVASACQTHKKRNQHPPIDCSCHASMDYRQTRICQWLCHLKFFTSSEKEWALLMGRRC